MQIRPPPASARSPKKHVVKVVLLQPLLALPRAMRFLLAPALDARPATIPIGQVGDLVLTDVRLAKFPRVRHLLHWTPVRTGLPFHSIPSIPPTSSQPAIPSGLRATPTPTHAQTRLLKPGASTFGFRTSFHLNRMAFRPRVGISVQLEAHIRRPPCLGGIGMFLNRSSGHT